MKSTIFQIKSVEYLVRRALLGLIICVFGSSVLLAQNPELKSRLAELKQSIAKNRAALAHYTWTEQDIISLKGEEKKEELFQVQIGPNGKPQKTSLDPNMSDDERHRRGLRGRIKEKKIDEYKEYVGDMRQLLQQYIPPQEVLLDQAYGSGNVMFGPAGVPNVARIVVSNYVKQGDSVTLIYDKQQKRLLSVEVSSYLSDPNDAVKLDVQFAALPDGTNHVATMQIDGASKHLGIAVSNTNYEKI